MESPIFTSPPPSSSSSKRAGSPHHADKTEQTPCSALIERQLAQERPACPFGPAWRVPPEEVHLWGRSLLNMMKINKERALGSLLRVRDANFVRDFQDFAERLKLRPSNYSHLSSKRGIIQVVDMIKTTLKGSVLSVQSLVWRTGRFRASVAVIQRWVRIKLAETRKVKTQLKIKWRLIETRARERIKAEIERRNAMHFGDVVSLATSASANSGSAASQALAFAVARARSTHDSPVPSSSRNKSPFSSTAGARSASPAGAAAAAAADPVPAQTAPVNSASSASQPTMSSNSPGGSGRRVKRRSPAEQRINDLLWSLLSDAWMDDTVMDAAIHRLLMHRRCRYVDCFRVWRATSLRDFRSSAENMNITRTARKLLECAMSLRFPHIKFTMDGVSIDELAYHAVAHQMQFPMPRPSVPPARPFLEYMPKNIWDIDGDEAESEEGSTLSGGSGDEQKRKQKKRDGDDDDDDEKCSSAGGDDESNKNNSNDGGGEVEVNNVVEEESSSQQADSSIGASKQNKLSLAIANNNDDHGGAVAAVEEDGPIFGQAAEKSVDLTRCTFSPLISVKREPQPMLPTKSMCFRKAKKEVTATINEALNKTVEDEDNNDEEEEDDEGDQQLPRRTGWTQEEIAELHEGRFADPMTLVLRHTTLPINELTGGGIEPPFNFYHALLSFNPNKLFLYAFMKQAVSGRRVLLESQLHGKEPREQCEEAVKVIRTWVYLRTVRALSSDEIVTLDITPKSRYAPDGTPVAKVVSHDDRHKSPAKKNAEIMRVAATVNHEEMRVSPPRSAIVKLIKPDNAASTSRLSTIFSVEAVPGVTTDFEHVKPYESVFVPHGVSAADVSAGSKKNNSSSTSRRSYSLSPSKETKPKHLMTTEEMATSMLSRLSPFRRKMIEAKQQKKNQHGEQDEGTETSTSCGGPTPATTATPTPRPMTPAAAAAVSAVPADSAASSAATSTTATSSRCYPQPSPISARSFPIDLPGIRALMPPPATAAVVSAPSSGRSTTSGKSKSSSHNKKVGENEETGKIHPLTARTTSLKKPHQPVPPKGKPRPESARPSASASASAAASAAASSVPAAAAATGETLSEQQSAAEHHHRPAPHPSYINTSGFMCTEQEYLEREFEDRRVWERRYVAPIRQRRNVVNNRMFVASERRAHAVEANLKRGATENVKKWHPGE